MKRKEREIERKRLLPNRILDVTLEFHFLALVLNYKAKHFQMNSIEEKRKSHQITSNMWGLVGVNGSDINNPKKKISTTLFHHLINKSLFALPIKGSRQHIEIHVPDQIRMPIEQREISTNKQTTTTTTMRAKKI